MKTNETKLIEVLPEEGYQLTKKNVEDLDRRFFSVMYLGITDSLDNYEEWTNEDVEIFLLKLKELELEKLNKEKEEYESLISL